MYIIKCWNVIFGRDDENFPSMSPPSSFLGISQNFGFDLA